LYNPEREYLVACLEDIADAVEDDGERSMKDKKLEIRYISRLIKKLKR
jgi:hypothetical protein